MMNLEQMSEFDGHEMVVAFSDQATHLKGYIAIHNTKLGPATGGTRYQAYASDEDALRDALKLSRAMTYKCALARVPFGGGKAVIIGDPAGKTPELLEAYAQVINKFGGSFTTGTDVGLVDADIKLMAKTSPYMLGVRASDKPGAPTTSGMAALGVFSAIETCLEQNGRPLHGARVAVKGLGKLGAALVDLLCAGGAEVVAADIDPAKVRAVKALHPGVTVADPATIHEQEVDVYSPCALGGELNSRTIQGLRCQIIAGGANNQLGHLDVADQLHRRNILFAPDYVINAGGLIHVVGELDKDGYVEADIYKKVRGVKSTLAEIFGESRSRGVPPSQVADEVAHARINPKITLA